MSVAAREYLERIPYSAAATYPAKDDVDGWRRHIKEFNALVEPVLRAQAGAAYERMEAGQIGGVTVYRSAPVGWDPRNRQVFLHMHGGGLYLLAGAGARALAAIQAERGGMPVVSVDYRMPPDHPFPAGLDDCVTVYEQLVGERGAENIIVGGESAGGNLAAAAILKARDRGLPMPAGAMLLSPEIDLTERGDTFSTLESVDVLKRLMPANLLYAAGAPLDDPYVSPLFGDFARGFPPTFLQSGTRDMFLSNTVSMHRALRRAGVEAHLHVWEAMPHGGFPGSPEEDELRDEVRRFIAACFERPCRGEGSP